VEKLEWTILDSAAIPGARLTIMKGMGHFPMIENYAGFRPYLLSALAHTAGAAELS
jgi:pimeloyl-ACP methyl ester carboxylesterase